MWFHDKSDHLSSFKSLIQRNSNSLLWFCSTGPEWYRIRSVLNPKMLKLQEVSAFAPIVHQVVGDLLGRVELLRSRSQDQATVSDLAAELYKFGFEGGSCCRFRLYR
ncbi:hypothetical protein AMECASPLE_039744 [Ameca splendens]|uniref:Cholesterol side-chain cleavage enzyme, mitochondrial n=1 Tax=Ameca splendens TaxID=208324 RepID=A0ABV0Z7D6_9TELE